MGLPTARTAPVGRKVLERDDVMFGGIVHIAADGADVLSGRSLEDDFARRNYGRRIVEIHDALLGKTLQRFRRVGAEIHRRTGAAEGTDAVEGLSRGGLIVEHDGEAVFVERDIGVGDIAVDEIEKSIRLNRHDAVARGVARSRDVGHSRRDALRGGELVIGAIGECRDGRIVGLDFVHLRLGSGTDDLGVRERTQFAGVVGVLMRDENLRDPLRLVAEVGERLEVGLDLCAKIDRGVRIGRRIGEFGGEAGIDEDNFAAGVDDPVLEAGAVLDRRGGAARSGANFRGSARRARPDRPLTRSFCRQINAFYPP